jgi:serine/threonine protein kinase
MFKKFYDINAEGHTKKSNETNINLSANINLSSTHTVNTINRTTSTSSSVKKIQTKSGHINTLNSNNISSNFNMNKLINKITSNSESMLNNLKKKPAAYINNNSHITNEHISPHHLNTNSAGSNLNTTNNLKESRESVNNVQINAQSPAQPNSINPLNKSINATGKTSMTTPTTNKNSRKNSLEKTAIKSIIKDSKFTTGSTNSPALTSYVNFNQNFKQAVSSSQNFKQQARLTAGNTHMSNYLSNNSNMSNNNSSSNLTNTSNTKLLMNNVNYEEINLVTDNSKKSHKMTGSANINGTNNPGTSVKNNLNFLRINSNNASNSNSLAGSQNFNNNLQIFEGINKDKEKDGSNVIRDSKVSNSNNTNNVSVVKGSNSNNQNTNNLNNVISSNNNPVTKKKPATAISVPLTSQSSKAGSKNTSKSRIDEKNDKAETNTSNPSNATAAFNIAKSENNNGTSSSSLKKPNTSMSNLNEKKTSATASNTTANLNINTSVGATGVGSSMNSHYNDSKLNIKKHLTSTNSPTHFPFNFNKDHVGGAGITASKHVINKNATNIKDKNSNSISKAREEAVTIKNKGVVSLVLNMSGNTNIKSTDKKEISAYNNISTSGVSKISKSGNSSKSKLTTVKDYIGTGNNTVKNSQFNSKPHSGNKTPNVVNTTSQHVSQHNSQHTSHYNHLNNPMPVQIDISCDAESLLNMSTSSIKSTVRESNYYRKEADKISSYIKQYFTTNNEYPSTTLKFYKFGRLLGRGAFGKVNLGLHIASGRLVAVKSFNKNRLASENAKKKIYHETNLMKNLKHNSIVKIFEVLESQKYILIVLEYVCGGDLLSFVRKRTKLNETTAKFIFRQIMEALQYIHSQGVIHRDIKLDNILIDLNNTIKICDFGVSRSVVPGDIMHDQCGTPAYIAPEILRNQGYEGFGVDVWSAGVVLYAMLSGTVPFKATNMTDLHRIILSGNYAAIKDISQDAIDLLKGILETDPRKRLSVEQILQHEWLKSTDEMFNGKIKSLNKLNLFANAERILLSKFNIDYRSAPKDDLIENFTLKNLDTNQESENQNVGTKSYILAPFNSSLKGTIATDLNITWLNPNLKIENDVLKFVGKAKEANRNYELNNNGEIDNGILINPQPQPQNISKDEEDEREKSPIHSKKPSQHVSKPTSPPSEYSKVGEVTSPNPDSHRNSRKGVKDLSMSNTNTFILGKMRN